MEKVSLSLVVLKTRQLDSLRRFYGSLGIELVEERHGSGPVHYSGQVGETVLEIYPLSEDNAAADTTTRFGFTVENLTALMHILKDSGIRIVREPKVTAWGRRAVVVDPDGRAIELYQR